MTEVAIIVWMYVWGALWVCVTLALNNVREGGGDTHMVGAVAIGIVWPISVPVVVSRLAIKRARGTLEK